MSRIALLCHRFPAPAADQEQWIPDLARALVDVGHEVTLIGPGAEARACSAELRRIPVRGWRRCDALLRARGFGDPLTHLPWVYLALHRGPFDLVHAFAAADAAVAARWARPRGRSSVYTCTEPPTRATVAAWRLRPRILAAAAHKVDRVTATSGETAAGLERWLACTPRLVGRDPGAYLALYEELGRGADLRPTSEDRSPISSR